MPAGTGLLNRDVTMTVGGITILGVVTKDFTFANAPVEVTDEQSNGFREVLAKGGVRSVDISISGDTKNYELLATFFSDTQMVAVNVDLGDGNTTESNLAFDALITELTFGGSANEKSEYSASLISSGRINFIAGT